MSVLSVDIGSSSVRAMLFDEAGQRLPYSKVQRQLEFQIDDRGRSTIDPVLLRLRTEDCISQLLIHAQAQAQPITAVSLATFAGNLVGLDARGKPLTPVYTYADTQCRNDLEILRSQVDVEAVRQRTGCPQHTAYQPARLHWLRRTQPIIFEQVSQWVDFATYFYRHWFGRTVPASTSLASWNGLLNRVELAWDREWLDLLHMDVSLFPPLAHFNETQSGLSSDYALKWPLLRDVPFFLAVGDGAAANVGSGAHQDDTLALTVGTTAAIRIIQNGAVPVVPEGLWSYRVDKHRHLTGGATSEGGNVFEWLIETLRLPDIETIERELQRRKPREHGLTFVPLLAGERSPGYEADATGSIVGLRLSTTPMDIMQAAMEGVAARLGMIANRLSPSNAPLRTSGGALERSEALAQMIADATGYPLALIDASELTARGSALLALEAMGKLNLNDCATPIRKTLLPRAEA